MDGSELLNNPATLMTLWSIVLLWTFFWKGMGLYNSARQQQNFWFVAMLMINTAGLLEIAYLFFFSTEKLTLNQLMNYFSPENLKALVKKNKKRQSK